MAIEKGCLRGQAHHATVRMPPELHARLPAVAGALALSMSDVIRLAAIAYVDHLDRERNQRRAN